MQILLVLVLVVHGLVHLLGFLKGFAVLELPALTLTISRGSGVCWLMAGLLLLVAAMAAAMSAPWWWMVSAPAIVLSQVLIGMSWADAKAGTAINVLLLLATVVAFGSFRFEREIRGELLALLAGAGPPADSAIPGQSSIQHMPVPVQRWLRRSGVLRHGPARFVRVQQEGEMRTDPGQVRWMHSISEQWFRVDPPAFIWSTKVSMMPLVTLLGRDRCVEGRGQMRISLHGLHDVVRAEGDKIDASASIRLLAEICWVPFLAFSPAITFEAIDDLSARGTLTVGGVVGSGIFHFTEQGDLLRFEARRYDGGGADARLEDWVVHMDETGEFDGLLVPVACRVSWQRPEGTFEWFRFRVTGLQVQP